MLRESHGSSFIVLFQNVKVDSSPCFMEAFQCFSVDTGCFFTHFESLSGHLTLTYESFNLDLISGIKYINLLTVNSLVKVGHYLDHSRSAFIHITGENRALTIEPLNKALSVFISPIL